MPANQQTPTPTPALPPELTREEEALRLHAAKIEAARRLKANPADPAALAAYRAAAAEVEMLKDLAEIEALSRRAEEVEQRRRELRERREQILRAHATVNRLNAGLVKAADVAEEAIAKFTEAVKLAVGIRREMELAAADLPPSTWLPDFSRDLGRRFVPVLLRRLVDEIPALRHDINAPPPSSGVLFDGTERATVATALRLPGVGSTEVPALPEEDVATEAARAVTGERPVPRTELHAPGPYPDETSRISKRANP